MLSETLRTGGTAEFVEELKSACEAARGNVTREWRNALRRMGGFLADDVDPIVTRENVTADVTQKQIVTVINFLYRNYLAFLARAVPRIRRPEAIAASREPADLRAAFAAGRMLKAELLGHRGQFTDELLRVISFVYALHTGYAIVEGVVPKGAQFGEVRLSASSVFDVYAFPGVRTLERSPAVVLRERMTREEIEERWGLVPKDTPGCQWPSETGMEQIQPGIQESLYEVLRLFIKPSPKFPQGAQRAYLAAQANNEKEIWKLRVKGKETIGTPDGKYPVVQVGDVPLGYQDFGVSRMVLTGPQQKVANIAYSRMVEAFTTLPIMTLFAPMTQGLTPDSVTNRTVAIVPYTPTPGHKPEWVATPIPEAAMRMLGLMEGSINDLTSQQPTSRGSSEGSRMPVGTTEALIQQSTEQDTALIERLREGFSVIGQRIIIEGQNVWPERKVFLTLGHQRKYEAGEFKKADLKEGFSVRIRPDDGMPKGMAERWEKVTKGMQSQLFGNTKDPQSAELASERARKLLEILDDEEEYALGLVDEQRATDHFLAILGGEQAQVSQFDNHRAHIKVEGEHAVDQMTATGQALPPQVEQALVEHRAQHVIAQQEVNLVMAGLDEMPPPEGPPPGAEEPGAEMGEPGEMPPEMGGMPTETMTEGQEAKPQFIEGGPEGEMPIV